MSKTVKIVLDERLRIAVDRAARRMKQSRSAFVRDALRAHIRRLEARSLEAPEREGYKKNLQRSDEVQL